MIKWIVFFAALAIFSITPPPFLQQPVYAAKTKKKKRSRDKKVRHKRKKTADKAKTKVQSAFQIVPSGDVQKALREKKAKEEAEKAKRKRAAKRGKRSRDKKTGRKNSRLDAEVLSRWSNQGAMTPIKAEVPIQSELPKRAQPILHRVNTPGQKFSGKEDQISARISLGAYHLETVAQDVDYIYNPNNPDDVFLTNLDRDIDLYRVRTDLHYTRIAKTWLSLHLDAEYRGADSPTRDTDYRLNAAYLAYGLSAARRRGEPRFGVALGRVVMREAGYASADGLAIRYTVLPGLFVGGFGGFTGNPYRYNWLKTKTEEFSSKWWRTGGFVSWQQEDLFIDLAAVATFANQDEQKMERIFVFAKSGLSLAKNIDLFLSGWFDVLPDGQRIQNIQAVGSYRPFSELYLRLAVERFSTVSYGFATAQSFRQDQDGARIQSTASMDAGRVATSTAVDEAGDDIKPFDATLQIATYDALRFRVGYRWARYFEPYVSFDGLIRRPDDSGYANAVAKTRFLPGLGLAFRRANWFDATVRTLAIIDDQADNHSILSARVSRSYKGLSASIDGKMYLGGTSGSDGGLSLAYQLPRDWFAGRLQLRGMLRYYRENLALDRPDGVKQILGNEDVLPNIPIQESYMGFVGLEWKL